MSTEKPFKPFVPAHRTLPEITLKGTILAIILTIILGASNCYLSLRVGMSVSASIPAAVISMGVLRLFKHSNILENNIVQTCASMGEATTSGLAFILPALIILHYWEGFYYWQTVLITLIAGFLGVLFGIPIRRVLLNDPALRFPEGTAIGEVLKASASSTANMIYLVMGGAIGAVINLCQSGFGLFSSAFSYYVARDSAVYGFGWGYSPALIAAGYIVGPIVAVSMFTGVLIGWIVGVPVLSYIDGVPHGVHLGQVIWSSHIRYIGVGTMLVGGIWTVLTLMKQVYFGVRASLRAMRQSHGVAQLPRTERDISLNWMIWILLVMFFCVLAFIYCETDAVSLGISSTVTWVIALTGALFVLFMGFVLCSVSGYFAGLVGATNNPASGLMVSGLLMMSLILLGIMTVSHVHMTNESRVVAAAVN
jgi:putative OPT family oligopeptide transporter